MNAESVYNSLLAYIRVRWPACLLFMAGALAATYMVVSGLERGLWTWVGGGLLLLVLVTYLGTTSLWAAYEQFGRPQTSPSRVLFELGNIEPTTDFVLIGLGVRDTAIQLSRRLTRGHIRAIDVYNPQLTPRPVLARRRRPLPPPSDPRITWLEGTVNLLPLPDNSVRLVVISYTLFEFWQHGDRDVLLRELRRALQPAGVILLAEPARTTTHLLMIGPGALRLPTPTYWRNLLRAAGFTVTREKDIGGYYRCFRAEKPLAGTVQQLALDLGI